MMTTTLAGRARDGHRDFSLFGSSTHAGVVSPYFQSTDTREEASKQGYSTISESMANKVLFHGYISDGNLPYCQVRYSLFDDTNGHFLEHVLDQFDNTGGATTQADLMARAKTQVIQHFEDESITIVPADIISEWEPYVNDSIAAAIPPAPKSYQTIVSQTGTAAPAVSGSLSPMSTYPSGTTFAWARTGAGVYTLTASTAVFNTSGKTGVFVAPLQNLNASVRAVVTSSTVITVTTAVQSVAILGLLGLTATNTDALLNGTMLAVQTYA